jgi:hypothetical protein
MKRAALLLSSLLASSLAYGQVQPASVVVPTLDDGGMLMMIALVGVIGGIMSRRRKK